MKQNYKLIMLMMIGLLFSTHFFAQDIMEIPPFDPEGNPALAAAISKDTTDTGERANLNRIYSLERGKIYIMDFTIRADFPIRIISHGDKSERPPILVRGKLSNGVNIRTFFTFVGDDLEHSFNNIIFTGVDLERKYDSEWNRGLKISGDNITLTIENCIMNAWAGLFLEIAGDNASLILRDNEWRNGVGISHPFWGQQNVCFAPTMNRLEVTNNTWFNSGGFWLFQENGITKEAIIEHNTLFTSAIDLLRMRDFVNVKFRSNLFYGTHAYAQNEAERMENWVDSDNEYVSFFTVDTSGVDVLDLIDIKEAEKNILLTHNTYFSPQVYKDYWASESLYVPTWMNTRTKAMFDNDDAYPLLIAEENKEMDPNFVDQDMVTYVTTELVKFSKKVRKKQLAKNRNYDVHTGSDLLQINWPLPESLVYTNAAMLEGGHDGLPVGDLNWYPEKRALYTGVDDISIQKNMTISKVTPNPTNGFTAIEFELNNPMEVEIILYNLNGNVIQTVLKDQLSKGIHSINLNLSGLSSGMYFYTLRTEKVLETQKIILY